MTARTLPPEQCYRTPAPLCRHEMHSRCTACKKEQYPPAVWAVSHGITPCPHCGVMNPVMPVLNSPAYLKPGDV